jgi:hypothetical protein
VAPFAISSSSQFRPPGPPSLDSEQYAADYNEVKELGAAVGSTRTEDQTQIALFWADGAGTETPPGHWNSIAQIIAAAQGNTLEENARLFALLNIAMADAAICAWDAKYTFQFWHPVTAINFAEPELNWASFIVTPPFPDYVSGHSTFSGAAATVLPLFYGTDDLPFITGSDFLLEVYRSFPTCLAAAEEAAVSRLYGAFTSDQQTKMACKRASASANGPLLITCSPKAIAREGNSPRIRWAAVPQSGRDMNRIWRRAQGMCSCRKRWPENTRVPRSSGWQYVFPVQPPLGAACVRKGRYSAFS